MKILALTILGCLISGCGTGDVTNALSSGLPSIIIAGQGNAIGGEGVGPDSGFTYNWNKDHPEQPLTVVQFAKGGVSMTDWAINYNAATASVPQYGALFPQLVTAYKNAGRPNVIAILWVQGETEADGYVDSTNYQTEMTQFISAAKTTFGTKIFIMAETQEHTPGLGKNLAYVQGVQQALAQSGQASLIDTSDLSVMPDSPSHFSMSSEFTLGERMYQAWKTQSN